MVFSVKLDIPTSMFIKDKIRSRKIAASFCQWLNLNFPNLDSIRHRLKRGGSGLSLMKNNFELGVGGEGQYTSQHMEGNFGSIRVILSR